MPVLNYEILTDPAPLRVSEAGAIHVVVTNPFVNPRKWLSIKLVVPVGQGQEVLTPDPSAVIGRIAYNDATGPGEDPLYDWDPTTGVFTVKAQGTRTFDGLASMVLVLEGFPVSDYPGLVQLQVIEERKKGQGTQTQVSTLNLWKHESKVPRNFRADKTLLGASDIVLLRWDGPATFTYQILDQNGNKQSVATPPQGTGPWEWSPRQSDAPKRDATYTLIATPKGAQQPGYFLTTTVHLRSPEFESVTATAGMHTPWVQGTTVNGRIHFTRQGADIRRTPTVQGTLTADTAKLKDLDTTRNATVGGALTVAGDVDAKKDLRITGNATVGGALTVTGGVDARDGLHVARDTTVGGALSVTGDVEAKSGLTTAHNAVVGGALTVTGGVDARDGLHVARDTVIGGALTAGGTVDAGDGLRVARDAVVGGALTVTGGVDTGGGLRAGRADIGGDLAVGGRVDAGGELHAARNAVVDGDLAVNGELALGELRVARNAAVGGALAVGGGVSAGGEVRAAGTVVVGGGLDVAGESVFSGMVNANALLAVRHDGVWLMKVNDDQVAVTNNLRVHGESVFSGMLNANARLVVRGTNKWLMKVDDEQTSIAANLRVHGAFRSDS